MSILVTLTPEQIEFADEVGRNRHRARISGGAIHRNNRQRNREADLSNDIKAARCELAGHLGLGTKHWDNGPLRYAGRKPADLDGFIDIKGRDLKHHQLIVQFDDPPDYAYVSVCSAEHPDYSIDGWCWGHECQKDRYRKSLVPGRPAFVVTMADMVLKSPHLLMRLAKERQHGGNGKPGTEVAAR